MTILVVGASGATGKHLVKDLLDKGFNVKAIVRDEKSLLESISNSKNLMIIKKNILEIPKSELASYVADCDAIASCLGHNLTFKGIYGKPRMLVRDGIKSLCEAVKSNETKKDVKFLLMNTSGNSNRDIQETISFAQKIVLGIIRSLVPPHLDNERAADFLRVNIGQEDSHIQWVVIRPDSLINEEYVSSYEVYASPIRSAIFDAGTTSRINVANFMSELISNNELWNKWKGQMPIIYNKGLNKNET